MSRTVSPLLTCAPAIMLLALLLVPCGAADEVQKLHVGEMTITYPTGLEAQAKELARVAREVIEPRRDAFLAVRKAVSDADDVARRITAVMGCPEYTDFVRAPIPRMLQAIDSHSGTFTDLRIYREADLKASGGLQEGCVKLTYDAAEDKFNLVVNVERSFPDEDPADLDKAFLPLVVRSDGTFRTKEDSLRGHVLITCDGVAAMPVLTIHELAEAVLCFQFHLWHPFGRWFNEAAANWVMLTVASEIAPDMEKKCREGCFPEPEDMALRGRVNLPAWEQIVYQKENPSEDEQALRKASYAFATEAIDRALRDQAPDTLAKIVGMLKSKPFADTEAICDAITQVTGEDFKSILLEYVPKHVREGLEQDQPKQLLAQARERMREKNYPGAVDLLTRVLEMTPCDTYARSNLVLAMRKAKMPKDQSERQIKICVGLGACTGELDVKLIGDGDDTHYVFARIAQLGGDKSAARKHFESALTSNPNHADAKAALKELDEEEHSTPSAVNTPRG